MSYRWEPERPREPAPRPSALGRLRIALRFALVCLIFGFGLPVFGLIRLGERLLGRRARLSRQFSGVVLGLVLRAIGLRLIRRGRIDPTAVGSVANHCSWIDILAIFACRPVTFVAKEEVSGWGLLGWFARLAGTIFVRRDPSAARGQAVALSQALAEGQHLLFFPEGTSTDGARVLPFRAPLFQPFLEAGAVRIQPLTIHYTAADGSVPHPYGFYADADFAPHALEVLALPPGRVTVTLHPALDVQSLGNRKALADAARSAVASAMPPEHRQAT